MEKNWSDEYFSEVCEKIKSNGFRVFQKTESHYGYYTDGKNVGYFQLAYNGYAGVELSTVSKRGPQYSVKGDPSGGYCLHELTENILQQAFWAHAKWATGFDREREVVKYKSWEDFYNNYWDKDNLIEV